WPQETKELNTFYPTSVLVTGFDIIFFWVARMIMMGLKFMGNVPFREIYIHGLVRDQDGQKMSKSKGNVLDPIDIIDGIELEELVTKRTTGLMQPQMAARIEKSTRRQFPDGIRPYGTDALRFTFAALATTGRDVVFDLGRVEGYRNFCNKLWNAARYVLMNTEGQDTGLKDDALFELSLADRWIDSRLQATVKTVNESLRHYRLDLAAQAIYEFLWSEYCDWYLELSKPVLTEATASEAACRGTRRTLVQVLETVLRLAHPIMPFITEEIWQRVAPLAGVPGETIMLQSYPQTDAKRIDEAAEAEMNWVQQVLLGVRRIRAEMNIAPGKPLPVLLANGTESDWQRLADNYVYLTRLGRLSAIDWLNPDNAEPESAIALVGELKILIPLAGLIDKDAEIARLSKEIEKLRKELIKSEAKLENSDFINRAPAAVVAKERDRQQEMRQAVTRLDEQLQRMQRL
ncbi:MAG: class I tRNA ligase family protein, partial [Candidatus Competibacteraceae bacterium]|nr:class I tRNA ligase family protein [Candidatus Competibacteraceae bacterium]